MQDTIHPKHLEWIEARGISAELAVDLGLFTKTEGGKRWISVPFIEHGKVLNHKYRLASEKRHMMDSGAPLTFWNHDVLLLDAVRSGQQTVVITEGEWDGMEIGRAHV